MFLSDFFNYIVSHYKNIFYQILNKNSINLHNSPHFRTGLKIKASFIHNPTFPFEKWILSYLHPLIPTIFSLQKPPSVSRVLSCLHMPYSYYRHVNRGEVDKNLNPLI